MRFYLNVLLIILDAQKLWESNKLVIRANYFNNLVIQTSSYAYFESQIESRISQNETTKMAGVGTVESKWKDWCSCISKTI